ncbi:MAG TPA: LPS assembly lipoprotein LptE, partial [Gemmatimonadales bacterium]|nr:LPS assembly lipoprotein LptE [Gemmatimonadales bacterium]
YKFSGGGLPKNIRTVAVLPFDNLTPEPILTQEITQAVREAVEKRLGLRQSGEDQADALVTGIVRRYEPDLPLSFTGTTSTNQVEVTRRMVQISLDVKIMDQKANKVLWERQGLMVEGEYDPNQEAQGRKKALDKLITDIVDGAQSQW